MGFPYQVRGPRRGRGLDAARGRGQQNHKPRNPAHGEVITAARDSPCTLPRRALTSGTPAHRVRYERRPLFQRNSASCAPAAPTAMWCLDQRGHIPFKKHRLLAPCNALRSGERSFQVKPLAPDHPTGDFFCTRTCVARPDSRQNATTFSINRPPPETILGPPRRATQIDWGDLLRRPTELA